MSNLTELLDGIVKDAAPEIKGIMRKKIDQFPDALDKILKAYLKDLLNIQE